MNIKVSKVCNIAKNSMCVPTGPYASICVIFFMHCNIFIYCKLPFHRTIQMLLYSTCTVMSLCHTDLHTFHFQTVLCTLVVYPAFSVTNQQTAVDRPQSALQHPHRLQTHYFHCSLCLQITTITKVYTTCSVCLSRLNFWYVCTLLLLLGLWCQH